MTVEGTIFESDESGLGSPSDGCPTHTSLPIGFSNTGPPSRPPWSPIPRTVEVLGQAIEDAKNVAQCSDYRLGRGQFQTSASSFLDRLTLLSPILAFSLPSRSLHNNSLRSFTTDDTMGSVPNAAKPYPPGIHVPCLTWFANDATQELDWDLQKKHLEFLITSGLDGSRQFSRVCSRAYLMASQLSSPGPMAKP